MRKNYVYCKIPDLFLGLTQFLSLVFYLGPISLALFFNVIHHFVYIYYIISDITFNHLCLSFPFVPN